MGGPPENFGMTFFWSNKFFFGSEKNYFLNFFFDVDLGGGPLSQTGEVDPGGGGAGGTPLAVTQEDCLVQ